MFCFNASSHIAYTSHCCNRKRFKLYSSLMVLMLLDILEHVHSNLQISMILHLLRLIKKNLRIMVGILSMNYHKRI